MILKINPNYNDFKSIIDEIYNFEPLHDVDIERSFTYLTNLLTCHRNRFKFENIEKYLFLMHHNKNVLYKQ